MRYRLNEKRLSQTPIPSPTRSLESEFASLSAKIDEVLEQLDAPIVAAEEALAQVRRRLVRRGAREALTVGGPVIVAPRSA